MDRMDREGGMRERNERGRRGGGKGTNTEREGGCGGVRVQETEAEREQGTSGQCESRRYEPGTGKSTLQQGMGHGPVSCSFSFGLPSCPLVRHAVCVCAMP